MARQSGNTPLRGTLNNTTYARTRNGYVARERTRLSKEMMDANPNYQALRDQSQEFTRALKASKLVNNCFSEILKKAKDNRMNNRLSSLFNKVVKLDAINPRGKRNVLDGELELLNDFEFNARTSLSSTLAITPDISINRATGEIKLVIPSFVPVSGLTFPPMATHFKVTLAAGIIDFETEKKESKTLEAAFQEISRESVPETSLTVTLSPGSELPLFVVCKISFAEEVNGIMEASGGGTFTACSLVKVDTGV